MIKRIVLTIASLTLVGCNQTSNNKAIDPLLGGELVLNEEAISVDRLHGMSSCVSSLGIVINTAGTGEVSFCDGSSKTIKKDRMLYEKTRLTVAPFRKISKLISESDPNQGSGISCDSYATDMGSILIRWDNDRNVTYDLGCKGSATVTAQKIAKEIIALIETLQTESAAP
jgi:hypothetical protein